MLSLVTAHAAAAFVEKWERNRLNETATAKEHFGDLCRLLGQPTPNEADPGGTFYRFEKPLTKVGGRAGFADVWKRDCFAWEYKSKGKYPNLRAAYQQLLLYKEDLDNPPILAACDIANYEIHIAFSGHKTRIEKFTNADLGSISTRELLHLVFTDPDQLRPAERVETITERAAARLASVAQLLEQRGVPPDQVASFFVKLIFAFFAEDIGLLPNHLMSASLKQAIGCPAEFPGVVRALFQVMDAGGYFGPLSRVPRFNGGLFADDAVVPLTIDEIQLLHDAARLDWREVEPAIFGTLFERSLDPTKRGQLGAHYTSRDDILRIIEPVLMAPLRREWHATQLAVAALQTSWEATSGPARQRLRNQMEGRLFEFMERLAQLRILDPACGSGNFLYVALHQLKHLEKEVWAYASGLGLTAPELGVTPLQFYGIEKNPYAAALAQVVVWIGYWQWKRTNGFPEVQEPILQSLDTIHCQDAVLQLERSGDPVEPAWPAADVIIGNPPFLGGKRLRTELGDGYVDALFRLYDGRVPREADLVAYWFERARARIAAGQAQRAGLLATQAIRAGANRRILEGIKQTGDIFMAWSDRPWMIDGAAVRVSMVGFDDGCEQQRWLNDRAVPSINANLTSALDLTQAQRLTENSGLSFMGDTKGGAFDVSAEIALQLLQAPGATQGCQNSDVVRPWVNGLDITRRPRGAWIIDFGADRPECDAARYERPFAYIQQAVKPERLKNNRAAYRERWWLHVEPRPAMRTAIAGLARYIATPRVAKHRLFVWVPAHTVPDSRLYVFARADDYFFGVLHAHAHEVWSLATGSRHGVGNDPTYNNSTCFETFPFPWSPGREANDDPCVAAIASAARALVDQRDAWLNPPDADEAELKQRTLTNLYNKRPDWLDLAHQQLDAAVLDAYGWPHGLSDEAILERLLTLNLARAAAQGDAMAAPDAADDAA